MDWNGAKLAVLSGGRILSLLRDERAGLPYPGLWDLPGGGREGGESAVDCVLREAREETGLIVDPRRIVWQRLYPDPRASDGPKRWFLVAELPPSEARGARLGDEGQALRWFGIAEFLKMDRAIPHLRARLRDYLADRARRESSAHM